MARRGPVRRRKRILAVAEGDSEQALARWLQRLCDEQGLHLHLDTAVAGGNDTRWVVEFAVDRRRRRNDTKVPDKGALVFLDSDRLEEDRDGGRDPETVRGRRDLELVYLKPNLEGLLIRLHCGHEKRFVAAQDTEARLRKLWPEYDKSVSAGALAARFDLDDLRRAARHDSSLRDALTFLGLLPGE